MLAIAEPVLTPLSEGRLHAVFPASFHPEVSRFRCLEAFGRTVCGLAPFLELEDTEGEEALVQKRLRALTEKAIDRATDPASEDFMNFTEGRQPLVDAAFLAHGILRAPHALYESLEPRVRANLASALRSTRPIVPNDSNWLLFAAMVEAALHRMGEETDPSRVERAVEKFSREWYVGDGTYSDGVWYHFDYYNSFVIQPMYLDVLRTFDKYADLLPEAVKRASRHARILEALIAPDGTYPLIGRSVCYRFGAFQLLSQAVLQEFLPADLAPSQVRCALSAVIKKCTEGGLFDENGYLTPGVYGCQPTLAEGYINTGSLYLCSTVFLPLGLPQQHPFWSGEDRKWSSRRLWSGESLPADHAID